MTELEEQQEYQNYLQNLHTARSCEPGFTRFEEDYIPQVKAIIQEDIACETPSDNDIKASIPASSHTVSEILVQRGNRYGEFDEHARITQNLKTTMTDSPNWSTLDPYMKESLEMLAHKIGRILNGDPHYDDSWIDICGYSQLVVDKLHKDQQ